VLNGSDLDHARQDQVAVLVQVAARAQEARDERQQG